ncbi:hypothetical protein K1719_024156 [Acacia pycnantha]|nr:hypothetical protein K1719_024156 [Acacia pycnantha]
MWLRNPFTRLSNETNEDLQITTDSYLGNPRSGNHNINTGFYFVRLNRKTRQFRCSKRGTVRRTYRKDRKNKTCLKLKDADVMWLRNPFTRLGNDTNDDLQISTDRYLGDPWSEKHDINTGFYFVRTNHIP